jgi:hypothetical protein
LKVYPEKFMEFVSQLSSTAEFGLPKPGLTFTIDMINFDDLDIDTIADAYWHASGYVDPSQYPLSPEDDDNNKLNLGLAKLFDDSDSGDDDGSVLPINHLCSSSSMPLDCLDDVLLTTCCNQLDPSSQALHALDI